MKALRYSLLLLLLPSVCMAAQNQGLSFTPAQSDVSVILLSNIFGVVGNILHGTGSQIVGEMFKVFNAAVLTIGGVLLFYIMIIATLNTAHQGEALGRNWSSIWIPIRAVMGIVLLVPQGSGYCLAQIFVMWLVVQGVGAGNQVWDKALDYLARGGVVVAHNIDATANAPAAEKQSINDTTNVAAGMLVSSICVQTIQGLLPSVRKVIRKATSGAINLPFADSLTASIDFNQMEADAQASSDRRRATRTMPFPNTALWKNTRWEVNIRGICGSISWEPIDIKTFKENLYASAGGVSTRGGIRSRGEQSPYGADEPTPLREDFDSDIAFFHAYQKHATAEAMKARGTFDPATAFATSAEFEETFLIEEVSPEALRDAEDSRAVSLQSMYESINNTARRIVDNLASPNPQQLGRLTDSANGTSWSSNTGESTLLTGHELKYAADNYLAFMRPTLNTLNGMVVGLNFIANAKRDGWIMAGSYFFNVAQANANINQFKTQSGKISSSNSDDKKAILGRFATLLGTNYVQVKGIFENDIKPYTNISVSSGTADSDCKNAPALGTVTGNIAAIKCYIAGAKKRTVRGDVGKRGPQYDFKFNYIQLDDMAPMGCAGWFCLISDLWNLTIVNAANFLVIPGINWLLILIQEAILIPLALLYEAIFNAMYTMFDNPGNPITMLAQVGDTIINTVAIIWAGIITAAAIGGNTPGVTPVLNLLVVMLPVVGSILGGLMTSGIVMAYYLPLIPYILFTFGAIGWFIAVIECMVAAPIVALGIAHPETHDAFGKAEPAVMLLLNVFLRPAMMVIGLVMGMILSYVGIWLLNEGFTRATSGMLDNVSGISSLFGPLAVIMIYVMLAMIIIQKAYSLIHILPDKILRWLSGGAQAAFGDEAAGMAQEAKGIAGREAAAPAGGVSRQLEHMRPGEGEGGGPSADVTTPTDLPPGGVSTPP